MWLGCDRMRQRTCRHSDWYLLTALTPLFHFGEKCDNTKQFAPLLVVGTKLDQAQIVRNSSSLRSSSPIAVQFRSDEINLDCMQPKYLAPATTNSIKLAKFFDKAIEYKMSCNSRKELSSEKTYFSSNQSDKMRERRETFTYSQYKSKPF